MKKSVMMIGVLLIAMSVSSCISSLTLGAGIGNSLGPLNDLLNGQQEENGIQSVGNMREMLVKACNTCEQNNWEGTTGVGADLPCSNLKEETCDEILGATP